MYKKRAAINIPSFKYQLVMCQQSCEEYSQMKYYVAVFLYDVDGSERDKLIGHGSNGYFIKNLVTNRWDYFDLEDFNTYFIVLDNCETNKKIYDTLYWLRKNRNIKIIVKPHIIDDGYWYEYYFDIYYPFNIMNRTENGFDNFVIAAKKAINITKKACIQAHGKEATDWLKYIIK